MLASGYYQGVNFVLTDISDEFGGEVSENLLEQMSHPDRSKTA